MDMEEQKLAFEKQKFEYTQQCDRQNSASAESAKFWSQLAVIIPILVVIIGFFVNVFFDKIQQSEAVDSAKRTSEREFINKQLAEFYYPIKSRLEKDDAVWCLVSPLTGKSPTMCDDLKKITSSTGPDDQQNKNNENAHSQQEINDAKFILEQQKLLEQNPQFFQYLEKTIIIPNHQEIIKIIDSNYGLIKNNCDSSKSITLKNLNDDIDQYERHVAVYVSLRTANINSLNPIAVCKTCAFPSTFEKSINSRIAELEAQRDNFLKPEHASWLGHTATKVCPNFT